ncbi:hypothetical protein EVAR_23914_1 [Eumeta japonica]|uniref:Uncharacterized protein n=1 Tax=Eumeta variegata TaxID=151549 RepID=A0A4C1V2R2_EUMVA|nr:hypothetical protein EVAR_23914_1 [Eumeta japonica]
MIGKKSKMSLRNKCTLYKVCIRPVMALGSAPVFAYAEPKALYQLQILQNNFCRRASGAPCRILRGSPPHHFIRRPRNVLSDPPDELTAEVERAITRRRHPMPIGRDRQSPQSSNLLGLRTTANQHVASEVFWFVKVGHTPRTRRYHFDDLRWQGADPANKELLDKAYAKIATTPPTTERTWYLTYFAVIHPAKPGKALVVLYVAAPSRGTSLNDHLLPGLSLLQSLPGVLMRFRQHVIAAAADVKDLFLRIGIIKRRPRRATLILVLRSAGKAGSRIENEISNFLRIKLPMYRIQWQEHQDAPYRISGSRTIDRCSPVHRRFLTKLRKYRESDKNSHRGPEHT